MKLINFGWEIFLGLSGPQLQSAEMACLIEVFVRKANGFLRFAFAVGGNVLLGRLRVYLGLVNEGWVSTAD